MFQKSFIPESSLLNPTSLKDFMEKFFLLDFAEVCGKEPDGDLSGTQPTMRCENSGITGQNGCFLRRGAGCVRMKLVAASQSENSDPLKGS